ncbi:ATP-binding cassette domain-containing protein [Paraburkholderia dipogonis]|uniref:ATP-binding cassette domain-containing protein n=1 Tax=Paraburkholderia dipogonis TaxID=1211383 RepID=A0A4Y8MT48_9BURK|nr:oligopeptide/dipeptide ABC transporter ATP-binding protein [Paraburkholderia dipogonis]TFE40568.1 ATP-binding cassette domain-containing protein [Paraburkholderia dipogonis]
MNAPHVMAPLVEVDHVSRRFVRHLNYAERIAGWLGARAEEQIVHAVDDVSLTIHRGEVVGLVGESGCGKSTLGRMLAGIGAPSSGSIRTIEKTAEPSAPGSEHDGTRAGQRTPRHRLATQMIFQDPLSSLNPRKRVRDIIGEAPLVHGIVERKQLDAYVVDVMERVGLNPDFRERFPHQFSGGQRQRIGIGRALAVKPDFLICDESIAALDVSIQAQIINLFMQLRRDLGLTYLFISHDLGVVEHISDRVAIMYLGRIVETAPTVELFANPQHPYTIALLAQVPRLSNRKRQFESIQGEIPSPLAPPDGCHFHPRCPHATQRCRTERPLLRQSGATHQVACHLVEVR